MSIANLVRNTFDHRGIPRITIAYATLVLVLLVVLLAQNTGRPAANTITMPPLPEEVVRIEIEDARGELTLLRGEDQWFVGAGSIVAGLPGSDTARIDSPGTGDEQLFPAREEAVTRLVDRLRELTRLEVVSERGSDQEYGFVEAARRRVRIEGSTGDSLLLELGFTAASGEAIYARLQGDRTVVRLPRALHNAVGSDPEDYRDMVVARIPEDTIRRVEIVGGIPGTLQVERVGVADRGDADRGDADRRDGRWEVTGDALDQLGAQVRPERVQDLLRELASLAAMGFTDEAKLPPPEPFVSIRVETIRGPTHTIEIAPPDDERRLPAVSTTSPYPFYLPEWRVRRLLLGIEAYLEPYMETPPQL